MTRRLPAAILPPIHAGRPVGNVALGRRFRARELARPALRIERANAALAAYTAKLARLGARQLSAFGEVSQ